VVTLEEGQKVKVRFKYIQSPDYKLVFANGAYGGMTARGNFVMHFFNEYRPPPKEETVTMDREGKVLETKPLWEDTDDERPAYLRELIVGVSVPREQAISIANWILEKMAAIESKKEVKSQ